MYIKRSILIQIFVIYISLNLVSAGFECALRDKLDRQIRDLERETRGSGRKSIKELFQKLKAKFAKKKNESSTLHGLAKNVEVILSKIIPNHNLVQDLMGYVTLPRLLRNYPVEQGSSTWEPQNPWIHLQF